VHEDDRDPPALIGRQARQDGEPIACLGTAEEAPELSLPDRGFRELGGDRGGLLELQGNGPALHRDRLGVARGIDLERAAEPPRDDSVVDIVEPEQRRRRDPDPPPDQAALDVDVLARDGARGERRAHSRGPIAIPHAADRQLGHGDEVDQAAIRPVEAAGVHPDLELPERQRVGTGCEVDRAAVA